MSDKHPCDHEDCPHNWCYRDPENWDYDNPDSIQVKPSGNTVYQIKFNRSEMKAVWQAAERSGLDTISYIHRMAILGNGTQALQTAANGTPITIWGEA